MATRSRRDRSRHVVAVLLACAASASSASPAAAGEGFALERLAGHDRYETSARIAEAFGVSSAAILASGEPGRSADALSANTLAGVQGAPVLLTRRDRVPPVIRTRLDALTGTRNVTIVGGTVAVSRAVEEDLRSDGFTVTRIAGEDRYDTSKRIIAAGGGSVNPVGIVVSGSGSFADAASVGPLAYADKRPVFLADGPRLPAATVEAIRAVGMTTGYVVGTRDVVPPSVEEQLVAMGITGMVRVGGVIGGGRSQTSYFFGRTLVLDHGFSTRTFDVTSGANDGVDALSAGPLSGKQRRALLLTDTATRGQDVVRFAASNRATLNAVGHLFGASAAVTTDLERAVELAGVQGVP